MINSNVHNVLIIVLIVMDQIQNNALNVSKDTIIIITNAHNAHHHVKHAILIQIIAHHATQANMKKMANV